MLSPKEVVKKWVDAFNAGDVDMIPFIYTDFFMEVLIYGSFTGKKPEKDLWLRQ